MDYIKLLTFLGVPEKWANVIVTAVVTAGFVWIIAGVTHNVINEKENNARLRSQNELILSMMYKFVVLNAQTQEQTYYLSLSVENLHHANIELNRECHKPAPNLQLIARIQEEANNIIVGKLPHRKMNIDSIRQTVYEIGVKLQKRN